MDNCGVYAIVNKANGHRYIGASCQLPRRWKNHQLALNRGIHHSKYLQRAWDKYGAKNFEFVILIICSRETRFINEQFYIDTYSPEYNICPTAGGGGYPGHCQGEKRSEEARQTIAMANQKRTGFKHTPEAIEKIRLANTKRIISQSTRDKLCLARKGMKFPSEWCANIGKSKLGSVVSEETRAKLSISQKNAWVVRKSGSNTA